MTRSNWTSANLRHIGGLVRQGRNPAATVYDSIGPEFLLALAPGWLNLGLWEGDGTADEAPVAVRRLVETLAAELPRGGTILDVGNGLGAQDPVIARVTRAASLIAVNITESQLRAGRDRLREAGAGAVAADATRLPIADGRVDGLISVEAAFHFPSRSMFFAEALRVLRPGGVLSMSDIATQRLPHGPLELLSGLTQLRVWGLRASAAATADEIVALARAAGFVDVGARLVGERVIAPALRFVRRRVESGLDAPPLYALACRVMLAQVERLWRHGLIDYLLLRATRP
jgi:erythromycin 3''-O-methyltransferase